MTEERPALEQSVATARDSYDKARALPSPDQHELSQARRKANLDEAAARATGWQRHLANTTPARASRDHSDRTSSRERQSPR